MARCRVCGIGIPHGMTHCIADFDDLDDDEREGFTAYPKGKPMSTIERVEAIRVALGARHAWTGPGENLHSYLTAMDLLSGRAATIRLQVGARLALLEKALALPASSRAGQAFPLDCRYMYLGEGADA